MKIMDADKLCHLLAGIAIAAVMYPFGPLLAMLAVIVIGIGKEVRDMLGDGMPEVNDALATIAGGVLFISWNWIWA
jgi:hypothetical protein